jgi:hypothetical protein
VFSKDPFGVPFNNSISINGTIIENSVNQQMVNEFNNKGSVNGYFILRGLLGPDTDSSENNLVDI